MQKFVVSFCSAPDQSSRQFRRRTRSPATKPFANIAIPEKWQTKEVGSRSSYFSRCAVSSSDAVEPGKIAEAMARRCATCGTKRPYGQGRYTRMKRESERMTCKIFLAGKNSKATDNPVRSVSVAETGPAGAYWCSPKRRRKHATS